MKNKHFYIISLIDIVYSTDIPNYKNNTTFCNLQRTLAGKWCFLDYYEEKHRGRHRMNPLDSLSFLWKGK